VHSDGTVERLDGAAGEVQWSVAGDGAGGSAGPLIDETSGVVVAGAADRTLRAVDLESGAVLWERQSPAGRIWGELAPAGDSVVTTETRVNPEAGADDFVALDITTGDERWRSQFTGLDGSIAMLGDVGVYGGGRRVVYDAATADELWHTDEVVSSVARPTAQLLTLEVEPQWDQALGGVDPDAVPELWAVDPRTGEERWRTSLAGAIDGYDGPPIEIDGRLLVGLTETDSSIESDEAGLLVALDPSDGHELWRLVRRDGVTTTPVATPHGLVVLTADGTIGCD
jgi:outer membrane protein assembly factor BamB